MIELTMVLLMLALTQLQAVFTNAGKAWVVLKNQSVAPNSNATMQWIAWGTGSSAENATQTALATEASEARVVGTLTQVTTTQTGDTDRCVGTLTANGSKNISEAGRFNQLAVGGTMLMRALFTAIPVILNDQIQFTLDLQVT